MNHLSHKVHQSIKNLGGSIKRFTMKKIFFLFLFIALQNVVLAHQNIIIAIDTTLPNTILDNQKS